jgi:hypothetical protein
MNASPVGDLASPPGEVCHEKHRIARTVRTCLVPAALVLSAGALIAGPLAPPPGPIASSYKTLSEVEPRTAVNATNTPGDAGCVYRISQHGSYYLTGNIFTARRPASSSMAAV